MPRSSISGSLSDTLSSTGVRGTLLASGLPVVLIAAVWHRLASGFTAGDGPWLVGVTTVAIVAGSLLLAALPMDGLSPGGSRAARVIGSAVLGAVGLFLATWAVVQDDFGTASMGAFVGLTAVLVALARWKPHLEVLAWMLFPYLFILSAYRFFAETAGYSRGPVTRPWSAEVFYWSFAGFALVMVGGGVLAMWKAAGPGRWATFSLVSAAFLGWATIPLPRMEVMWSARDRVYTGLALAAMYALAAYLCRPEDGRSGAPPTEYENRRDLSIAKDFARWSSPLAATMLLGLGSVALTAWAVTRGLGSLPALLTLILLAVALAAWERSDRIVRGLAAVPIAVYYLLKAPDLQASGELVQWLALGITLVGMLAVVVLLETGANASRPETRGGVGLARLVLILAVGVLVFDLLPFVDTPPGSPGTLWQELAPGLAATFFGVALLSLTTLRSSWVGVAEAMAGLSCAGMGLVWVLMRSLDPLLLAGGYGRSVPIFNQWLWTLGVAMALSILAARLVSHSRTSQGGDAFDDPWQQVLQLAFLAAGSLFGFLWISLEAGRVLGRVGSIALGLVISGSMLVWLSRRWVLRRPRRAI